MITTLSYDAVVSKLKEKGLSETEIEEKIKSKMDQLSGLISKEGAAHIIANEVGVKMFEEVGEVKVKDAREGMRNVNVNGKVTMNFGIKEFKTEKREGRVGSFVMGDDTGTIRVVLWDDGHINSMESLKEGFIVRVENGYVKENNGYKEVHLNNGSKFELNPEGVDIGEVKISSNGIVELKSKDIKDLGAGDRVSIKGTIVQAFEPRFYEICKQCGGRARREEEGFKCAKHGVVEPDYASVVSCVLDDGTESVRVVCFREQAGELFGVEPSELSKLRESPADFEKLKEGALGRQIKVEGRANKNEMFERLEFVANKLGELKPEDILKQEA
jgi:hypothetical protein